MEDRERNPTLSLLDLRSSILDEFPWLPTASRPRASSFLLLLGFFLWFVRGALRLRRAHCLRLGNRFLLDLLHDHGLGILPVMQANQQAVVAGQEQPVGQFVGDRYHEITGIEDGK